MKAKDLSEKSLDDLREMEKTLVKDVFQNRLKNFTNRLDDTSAVRKTKRELARVKTLLHESVLGLVRAGAAAAERVERVAKPAAPPSKPAAKAEAKSSPTIPEAPPSTAKKAAPSAPAKAKKAAAPKAEAKAPDSKAAPKKKTTAKAAKEAK